MKLSYIFAALLVIASASAYMTPYSTGYYGPRAVVNSYDGYHLTYPGAVYAYPPNSAFVSDRLVTGHYQGYTGRYYDAWGRSAPRNWYGYEHSNAVPARYYPQLNTVHYG
jgi:hypothetical protein